MTTIAFFYLLDTVRVNSATLFAINKNFDPKMCKAFHYTLYLAEQLVMPQIDWRKKVGLSSNIVKKIEIVTGETVATGKVAEPKKPRRWSTCMESIKGCNYSKKKMTTGKVKVFCSKCKSHCCTKHAILFCKNWLEGQDILFTIYFTNLVKKVFSCYWNLKYYFSSLYNWEITIPILNF